MPTIIEQDAPLAVTIVPAGSPHAPSIAAIYNHYITNTCITFELDPVTPAEMEKRIADVQGIGLPWLVALEGEEVLGYAYATQWRARKAYRSSVETTIYMAAEHCGRGHGRTLYTALLGTLQALDVHAVIGGVALPNEGSVRLHEALAFKKVAHFEQVGHKLGRWVDVAYWQRLLHSDAAALKGEVVSQGA